MTKKDRLHKNLTEGALFPLLLKLSIPTTVGMVMISLYSLADAYYVSHLGAEAGAAVGVAFSIHVLIQAIGYTFGLGGGSLLSRALGEQNKERAGGIATYALSGSFFCGLLVLLIGIPMRHSLVRLLGATEQIAEIAAAYTFWLLLAAPFMCAAFTMGQLLRAQGRATASMIGLGVGCICNVILDPVLIREAQMGITGASLATFISQCLSFSILLLCFMGRHDRVSLFSSSDFKGFRDLLRLLGSGLPSLFRQGLSGTATILLNRATSASGAGALAAVSVVGRIFLLVFGFCLGVGQGHMSIVGYNVGCGRIDRVGRIYRMAVLFSSVGMLLLSIPMYAAAPWIISLFREEPEIVRIGAYGLRAQALVLFTHGLVTCTILFFQAVGRSATATVLASARQGIFFLPLVLLLFKNSDIYRILLIQPIADGATFLFAIPFFAYVLRRTKGTAEKGTAVRRKL